MNRECNQKNGAIFSVKKVKKMYWEYNVTKRLLAYDSFIDLL